MVITMTSTSEEKAINHETNYNWQNKKYSLPVNKGSCEIWRIIEWSLLFLTSKNLGSMECVPLKIISLQ